MPLHHLLGDDLSLLSRQRDRAENGLVQVAAELPSADFRTLLDTFNDRWVCSARFLSTQLVMELLRLTGEWTACYYETVDPAAPGEPVGFFGVRRGSSPLWHAIAREYVERWVHHSQIRRAVGLGSLADEPFLRVGIEVVAAAAEMESGIPTESNGSWSPTMIRRAGCRKMPLGLHGCAARRLVVTPPRKAKSAMKGLEPLGILLV